MSNFFTPPSSNRFDFLTQESDEIDDQNDHNDQIYQYKYPLHQQSRQEYQNLSH